MKNALSKLNFRFVSIVVPLLITIGCVTVPIQEGYRVVVDSIAATNVGPGKTYILVPGSNGVSINDLQFQEYASYLVKILKSKGFVKVNVGESADLAVFLVYGIGDPQEHYYSYSAPVWGQTGVSSSRTTGTINRYGSSSSYSSKTTYSPSYGVTGYVPVSGSYVTYNRYFLLTAYDLKQYLKTKEDIQVWRTVVASVGASGDLRRVFPALVVASSPSIGMNTGQKVTVDLALNDPRISSLVLANPFQQTSGTAVMSRLNTLISGTRIRIESTNGTAIEQSYSRHNDNYLYVCPGVCLMNEVAIPIGLISKIDVLP
jgi:hypothetical protein